MGNVIWLLRGCASGRGAKAAGNSSAEAHPADAPLPQRFLQSEVPGQGGSGPRNLVLIEVQATLTCDLGCEREKERGTRAALDIEDWPADERLHGPQPAGQKVAGDHSRVQAVDAEAGAGHAPGESEGRQYVGEL